MAKTQHNLKAHSGRQILGAVVLGLLALAGVIVLLGGAPARAGGPVPGGGVPSGTGVAPASTNCAGWTLVSYPPDPSSYSNEFKAVFARGSSDVWAVGDDTDQTTGSHTLTEHWNGSAWTLVPSVDANPNVNTLTGVSGSAANDVWAVGYTYSMANGGATVPMAEHWNGSAWQLASVPTFGYYAELHGVATLAPDNAWAVGFYFGTSSSDFHSFILHWDGSQWSTSDTSSGLQTLFSVSARGSDVWAVGQAGTAGNPLFMHWTGSAWSATTDSAVSGVLHTVAITPSGGAWAAGGDSNGAPLTEHWDGTTWSRVSAPTPSGNDQLAAVAVVADNDVWAAGTQTTDGGLRTLTEHWDGSQWTIVPSLDPSTQSDILSGVAAGGPDDVWAVGTQNDSPQHTLLEHYQDAPTCGSPSPTPTVTATPAPACPIQYTDVPPGSPFYDFVRCLACQGIVTGYADGTFRPGSSVTRGQLAKFVANAAGFSETIPDTQQTFADVLHGSPFWLFVERSALHGLISGYDCGGPGEPCDAQQRKYFRQSANVTRGQVSKIVSVAVGYTDPIPVAQQTFTDVPQANPFWLPVERVTGHGIVSGYGCGSNPGEPCDPQNRNYFRPYANVTRGQVAKIISSAFFPACQTQGAR